MCRRHRLPLPPRIAVMKIQRNLRIVLSRWQQGEAEVLALLQVNHSREGKTDTYVYDFM